MKKLSSVVIALFFLLICLFQTVSAQKAHPYLFYTQERVQRLKERMQKDTLLRANWFAIERRCDGWISGAKGADPEQLAFAYRMTGKKAYAERAKQLLLDIVARPYWDRMDDRTPSWKAGLNTSHTGWKAAVVFDAIYDDLRKAERRQIADKIMQLGIQPVFDDWLSKDKRIQSLNNMGHNWWSAIVFEAGNCCLAVMDEIPDAKEMARQIMRVSPQFFGFNGSVLENKPASFDPDGGLYESISYANYALSQYLLFRLAWTNSIGTVSMPYDPLLQKSVDWFINSCYPGSGPLISLNFGDSNDFANGECPAKLLLALGLGKDDDYWYLKETAKDDFRESMNIHTPMGLLYQPDPKPVPGRPLLATSAIYHTMGWAMLRDSWKPDATLLGVKCGFTWNHAHADAGSFVLYHNGQNLLIDGGDVGYGAPQYSDYFVTSRAHNVIMFNGMAQDPQDQYHAVKTPGRLYDLLDGGRLKYLLADATGPTSRNFLRNYRNFLWIGKVILVIDDVHTYDIGQFDFLLHYADTAIKKGPDLEISKGHAGILFRPLYPEALPTGYPHDFPEKLKYRTEYGIKERTTDVKIPYYVLTPPEKSDRTKFVNAILLLDSTNKAVETFTGSSGADAAPGRTHLPVIEKFRGNDYLGIRIRQSGLVTEVYINLLADGRLMHRNSSLTFNGWETDAYITALTFPEDADRNNVKKLSSYFVANGSYLRKDGKPLLSALSKVFTYVEKDGRDLHVQLKGQPVVELSLAADNVKKLEVNGAPGRLSYDADKMLLIPGQQPL